MLAVHVYGKEIKSTMAAPLLALSSTILLFIQNFNCSFGTVPCGNDRIYSSSCFIVLIDISANNLMTLNIVHRIYRMLVLRESDEEQYTCD